MDSHSCSACGYNSPRWFGRCPECGAWSSAAPPATGSGALQVAELTDLGDGPARWATGMQELDRVLGGGVVPGAVVLLCGDPGAGKSTLVLQLMASAARRGIHSLLITGEESTAQIAARAARIDASEAGLQVAASRSLRATIATSVEAASDLLVVDSIQTLEDDRLEQSAGSVVQVRECAIALTAHAKATGTAVVMVGHVTKDGSVAGPKTLEHLVDVVLSLDGESDGALRLLRATKNRFGSCDEAGVFTMDPSGLVAVPDPSSVLLADRCDVISGSCVFPSVQGSRPMLVEIQALVSSSDLAQPRRVALGIEGRRLALLLGVLDNSGGLKLVKNDVFVSAAGGLAIHEPAADLAVCLALFSAAHARPLPPRMVAIGEVGLGGELRRVPGIERRLNEAHRLGFTDAIVPPGVERAPQLRLHSVPHVGAAVSLLSARKVDRSDERVALVRST